MKREILSRGAQQLRYEIREIVAVANKFQELGVEITWENIGDPVKKGGGIPLWMKEIVAKQIMKDESWEYCNTEGIEETREFLAEFKNRSNGSQITKDNIIFFNGLGDAIQKVYGRLRREARVIGPNPSYSTHASAEAAHTGDKYISYKLNPHNFWYPDIEDIKNNARYNRAIVGITIINPNNPTGAVYPKKTLEEIVQIAKEQDLFIVSDEIYINMAFNGKRAVPLSEVIEDVPGIAMRGISKEFPWPGSRCGWIEVYNSEKNKQFAEYVKSILDEKRLEVCSTTLPQSVIPLIMGDFRYREHVKTRNQMYEKKANSAFNILSDISGVIANKVNGAFYQTIMFEEGVLNERQTLPIKNKAVKEHVEKTVEGVSLDQRFVYYLLGSTGICVVPLSTGFNCDLHGFRSTLLDVNDSKFEWIYSTIKDSIKKYIESA